AQPPRPHPGVRGQLHRAALLLAAAGLMLLAALVALLAVLALGAGQARDIDGAVGAPQPHDAHLGELAPQPPPATVEAWVRRRPVGRAVPRRFLGLSFELSSLEQIAQLATRGDLLTLLRSLGPGMLRFGGVS